MRVLALALLVGCGATPDTTTLPSSSGTVAAAALRAALTEVCGHIDLADAGARFALSLTCALLAPPAASEVPDAGHGG